MKNILKWTALVASALLLTSCQRVGSEMHQIVGDMIARDAITPEQGQAFLQIVDEFSSQEQWWHMPLRILGEAGLTFLGINLYRGRPTQRVGLPEDKIHKP